MNYRVFSYEKKKKIIELIHADYIQKNDVDKVFFLGNVHMKYKKYHIYCDRAFFYKKNNKFYGYGNVQIKKGENKIFSKKIEYTEEYFKLSGRVTLFYGKIKLMSNDIIYNFRKKIFQAINNVVLFLDDFKLNTNTLVYDLKTQKIYYKNKSIITCGKLNISSKEGYYFILKKKVELKYGVKLITKKYTVYSNFLEYFPKQQKKINFCHPIIIIQNDKINNFIYADKAYFFLKKEIFVFKYSRIHYNDKILKVKYFFFDQKKKYGFIKNIILEDKTNKYLLIGGYGELNLNYNSFILKKNVKIIKIFKKKPIVIYSDKLKISLKKDYLIQAFLVKSYLLNNNIQIICNSLHYKLSDKFIKLDGNPIIWFNNQQIMGNSIFIYFNNNFLKKIKIIKNASYIEKINNNDFNQIGGDIITGFFKENILEKILIQGNVNSIFFLYPSKDIKIINKSSYGTLSLDLYQGKKIKKIYSTEPILSELIPVKNIKKLFFIPNFFWKKKPKKIKNFIIYEEIEKYRKENLLEIEKIKKIKLNSYE
ncbi:OstA-like protein [Blattabacterium cuenoti]|uniref:OstA-like protein n=1 Tax=Blattabacterium cuenoti TaxID=1653831 RepID=UPI001EEB085D|nr:OstA-like protein [Blattabacterium cuenoti]